MTDSPLGDEPIAYTALPKGARVVTTTGAEIGTVEHVLQDSSLDLFDGLAVRTREGVRFVDADSITTLTRSAVQTTIADADVHDLPAPDGDAVLEADPTQYQGDGLSAWWGRTFMREHWTRERNQRRD